MKIVLAIPTYNAGKSFTDVCNLINSQSSIIDEVVIVDSSSKDETVKIAKDSGFKIKIIGKSEFSHGGTRRKISEYYSSNGFDYIIFMSQDVFLQQSALRNLYDFIASDSSLGVVFGKQEVDIKKGNIYEKFARSFNYPEESYIRSIEDKYEYGIKTIFSSDAFSMYDLSKMKEVDYFDDNLNVSEDMLIAHKFIEANYKIGYCSEAKVYHTHDYSLKEEFTRYISIGRFYRENNGIINSYGKTNSNGIQLVLGEIKYLYNNESILKIPYSILRNVAKYLGHKYGYYLKSN